MLRYILVFSIFCSGCFYNTASAIGKYNPINSQENCYNLYWEINDSQIQAGVNIGIIADTDDLAVAQDKTFLNIHPLDTREDYIGYTVHGLIGDTKELIDDNITTSLSLNPQYGNEVLIEFQKIIQSKTIKLIYIDTASFYNKNFYYSIDGKNFIQFDHFNLNQYKFKYLKIVYIPKPEKNPSDNEIINIPEISIKDTKQLFVVQAISNTPLEIYGQNTCKFGTGNTSLLDESLELTDTSPIYNINLTTKEEYKKVWGNTSVENINPPEQISDIKITKNNPILPPLDKLVYALLAFAFILVITLYIRENAKLKNEKGLLPQNSVLGLNTKQDIKKIFKTIKETTKELKEIQDIESVEMTIGKSKKKKIFTSEKLLRLLGVITSHYDKNKNTFLPGELKNIYKSIIDNFKHDLKSTDHKKALEFINEFVEKGGKLVINKKKSNKK